MARTKWLRAMDILLAGGLLSAVCSCSAIDEDLSDCGEELTIDYDLHLVTNLNIELQTELDRRNDANLIRALREYLSPVFVDYAHDIDLSFYDVQGDSARLHHVQDIMDANEVVYTLFLPRRDYMHTAVANVQDNEVVTLEGDSYCHTARLWQQRGDTVSTHRTGLFTARQKLEIKEGVSQTLHVDLYMANCAAALVLDTSLATLKDIKVVATGFASRFNIADSTYLFAEHPPIVMTDRIETGNNGQMCFGTVNLPSKEPRDIEAIGEDIKGTRTIIQAEEPFVSEDAIDALWQFHVYTTLPDGKVTRSVLGVKKPLRPGQLKILHAQVFPNGALESDEKEVGVSITLDWKQGGQHEIPL